MKLYLAYKKQFKIINFVILLMVLLVAPLVFSHAQTAQDLQSKINQKDSDIQNLEKEIAAYQSQLDTLGQQKNSLNKSLAELDLTRKKLVADISVTQKKIDKTNLTIENLTSDIGVKQDTITNNTDAIKLEIRNTNEFEQDDIVYTLLSENNFTTIWNDIDNIVTVRDKIRADVVKLKQAKGVLEDTRTKTIDAKNQLTALKSQLADQQKIVIQNTNEKNKLLKQTKNNEANYQKLLKDRIAQRDAFEKELRDYEAQLQYILDPSKLPQSGVLSWPLEKVFVTQLFGKTVAAKRLYASGTHSGVDFRASVGTPVMSMADGTVLGIGDTDLTCVGASFGKFVFIKYNNGLSSTFGHLSLIKVYEGQVVKRGEVVAYSGATGHVTGPHLHVSLYASDAVKMASKPSLSCGGRIYRQPIAPINAYLDVLYYLPPYTINTSILNNRVTE
ncbi:MAG TPA: peptidoglycan DD-metalloendopeptidase family protein [Candidatus Paceibacterota bacterium]|nr:peptidoglycan DD-metalloendopeptidase family protein [Candidatus Paceibacterota bacterium]